MEVEKKYACQWWGEGGLRVFCMEHNRGLVTCHEG